MARKANLRMKFPKGKNRGPASTQSLLEELARTDTIRPEPRTQKVRPLEARTEQQGLYMSTIDRSDVTFGIGPAGTGKTFVAGAMAADAIIAGTHKTIIITRPAVEAGENLGFLPGELEDKFAPYIAAFMGVLNKRLGKGRVEYMLKSEQIVAQPLAFMRGLTFDDAFVIMDEAQNATIEQMKLFLTRIGQGCTVIVNGDTEQVDIPVTSGLGDAVRRFKNVPGFSTVAFSEEDIVRGGVCAAAVRAYAT